MIRGEKEVREGVQGRSWDEHGRQRAASGSPGGERAGCA